MFYNQDEFPFRKLSLIASGLYFGYDPPPEDNDDKLPFSKIPLYENISNIYIIKSALDFKRINDINFRQLLDDDNKLNKYKLRNILIDYYFSGAHGIFVIEYTDGIKWVFGLSKNNNQYTSVDIFA